MDAAELFIKCLEAEGVEYIFGLPGEENAHFMMALEKSKTIKFILARHEQGAAFMADAYGKLTGRPGVCLGTLGPGATNLITGVADGNMDRAPMIVITGQADVQRQHKESHQAMDVVGMFNPVTKWATPVLHPDVIPEVVAKAFKLARSEKPGACHIELAEDIAESPAEGQPEPSMPLRRPVPDPKVLNQVADLIKQAKRPVILAGNGCIRRRASAELRRLTELTGIGAMCTFMGKGSVARDSDHCLFTIGLQSKDVVACALDASDLVIAIGYDLVEYHPKLWNKDANKRILHIDVEPAEVDHYYRTSVEVVGDIASGLAELCDRLESEKPRSFGQQASVREEMLADFAKHSGDDGDGPIRPQKVLWDVRRALGPDDILLSDVGAHKMWIARYYQCDEPNTCLIPNGFCSMGFALPGAIAAKLIYPDKRVLAISGDGGFLMNVQELETARRLGTNPVFMVWEDGEYGLIAWKQENQFGRHTDLSFGNPDFGKLAEAFGCRGIRVDRPGDLAAALEEAFTSDIPVVLSLPIDYRENGLLTQRLGDIACPI
ncbi:MAG: acetolactate synthase large subunit [Planctomycetota bacterium]|jgi:acetolactate synthase-1/2/3 large subunit